jgi:stringent starvation protein B
MVASMGSSLTELNEQKRLLAEALLPLCPFVLIDAAKPDVTVPESLKRSDLVLRIGMDPKVMGMPDLNLDAKGFQATISIQGMRHFVSVPWSRISRLWVGEPFVGPMIVWPELVQKAPEPEKPVGLRLVKG